MKRFEHAFGSYVTKGGGPHGHALSRGMLSLRLLEPLDCECYQVGSCKDCADVIGDHNLINPRTIMDEYLI